eukprot:614071-Rhodomonas_salina.1
MAAAKAALAAQLDALMGKERDVPVDKFSRAFDVFCPSTRYVGVGHHRALEYPETAPLTSSVGLQRQNKKLTHEDEEVDKYWLCGLSPYILFRNTRSDLGVWDKITHHDSPAVLLRAWSLPGILFYACSPPKEFSAAASRRMTTPKRRGMRSPKRRRTSSATSTI